MASNLLRARRSSTCQGETHASHTLWSPRPGAGRCRRLGGVRRSAQAAAIIKDNTIVNVIPGLTGFTTTGAMMTGLRVTANFSSGASQSLLWATTGVNSGGVSAANWGLSLNGDSFNTAWIFTLTAGTLGSLLSLQLDGTDALTVFDTTDPSFGTPDSAQGMDFDIVGNAALNAASIATYTRVVAVSPNGPIGDLYQTLRVTFGPNGTTTGFSFMQDTDNDSRFTTPEPGTMLLVGLALAAAGALRRRA